MSETNGTTTVAKNDTSVATFATLPLSAIAISKTNPRTHFDDEKLADLAASIKSKGVLQPILVRPRIRHKDDRQKHWGGYELVAGERRYRAAKLAGLDVIPCIVRDLSDLETREVQVIENLQREDLHPLDEAAGYQDLLDEHGYTVEGLAAKLGKSKAYVYGVVKLTLLPESARQAMWDDKIPKSTAELIARIPNAELREKAAKEILDGEDGYKYLGQSDGPMSFREAKEMIERDYTVELKKAPFGKKDATLVPEAGACTACPKMTGNNREAFPDGRADVCTDPVCFKGKCEAHKTRILDLARECGQKVLDEKEANKIFTYDRLSYDSKYVDLADQAQLDEKRRSYKALVGKDLAEAIVVGVDATGQIHEIVDKDAALKVMKEKHGINIGSRRSNWESDGFRKREAKRREEERSHKEVARALMAEAAEKVQTAAFDAIGFGPAFTAKLRAIVAGILDATWSDVCRQVCKRRGLAMDPKDRGHGDQRSPLEKLLPGLDARELIGLLAELVAGRKMLNAYEREGKEPFWTALGIDRAKIKQQVLADKKAAKKKPAKKREKVHA